MTRTLGRREFIAAAPAAAWTLARAARGRTSPASPAGGAGVFRIEPFDHRGVRLGASRWADQLRNARDHYFAIPDDDILKGFREGAGLPAPGRHLGGWAAQNAGVIFGQWLSGMARIYRAAGDTAMRDKAAHLLVEFARTVKPDGDCGMRHYTFDKLVGGLVDMAVYADHPEAVPLLERVTTWASRSLDRTNLPATPDARYSGQPGEWYTLSENLFRAFAATGDPKFKAFAEAWLYRAYWDQFQDSASPRAAFGLHAYSHVNTFGGAAMAYAVSGDPKYLRILRNAYDFLQNVQCYATGGYGPNEHTVPADGSLGKALESRYDTFETPCGSWAGFKMARYLMQFTGEARYGDWIERLLYNGIGAALPPGPGGRNYYYSDYRIGGGMKVYNWETYTCCSGTYLQDVAEYHNLIYFRDSGGLYVNLYLPSEAVWNRPEGEVRLALRTGYPEKETVSLSLAMPRKMAFGLRFRVPAWAERMSVAVNGTAAGIACTPGSWAVIDRTWTPGDAIELRIPLSFRFQPVDRWHPQRLAVVRGPVVWVQDHSHHNPALRLPVGNDELNERLRPDPEQPDAYRLNGIPGRIEALRFRPFYALGEGYAYRMYLDAKALPEVLW